MHGTCYNITPFLGEFVGSLEAVNEHLSKEGLLRQTQIQPLISETSLEPKTPEIVRKFRKERIGNEEEVEDAALIEVSLVYSRCLLHYHTSPTFSPLIYSALLVSRVYD